MKTFKEFLEYKCMEETHCIKDNFEEHWEKWYMEFLEAIETSGDEKLMRLTEEWKKEILKDIMKSCMPRQKAYCIVENVPMFVNNDGICFKCKKKIEDQGEEHITGCPHCNKSFCD